MFYYVSATVLGILVILCLLWDMLYGRDRRILRSREHCYRDLNIHPLTDEDFCAHSLFKKYKIPKDFTMRMRRDLADKYLDFPVEKLHPDMVWEEIPLDPSPWQRDIEGLYDFVDELAGNHKYKFENKTVAQIIVDLYSMTESKNRG